MKLGTTKQLDALRPVLKNPDSTGPDPVYWVFYELTENEWANNTNIAPGKIGEEFTKTFGHYHASESPVEIYKVLAGEGVLQLQKKHLENNQHVPNKVDEVYLVRGKAGDEIHIPEDFGHSWSNVGKLPLIQFDNWRSGHTPSDYEPIEKMHGMAYYLIEKDGEVTPVPNPNYQSLPEPKWVSPEEFNSIVRK